MTTVSKVIAREILDSRGLPTIEVDITLSDGSTGRASVPSGASVGKNEAIELRDRNPGRFGGLGVLKAVSNVKDIIAPHIIGVDALNQSSLDLRIKDLDGTQNKKVLGANAMLAVSIAVAKASAKSQHIPLYKYLAAGTEPLLPVPMFNIINGGKHARDSIDFQEFLIVPFGFETFRNALRAGAEVYSALKNLLAERDLNTNIGDEGGYAPTLASNREAMELLLHAIEHAGYQPGNQICIAVDVASTELILPNGLYNLSLEGSTKTPEQMIELYESWALEYPLISIEDGLAEDDWTGWQQATRRLGDRVQLVGDDLYTTNPILINKGIQQKSSNAVLIKLNQIGTISETLEAIEIAKTAGWGTVISHRSGETEDTTIADLAVMTAAGQIKSGAPARSERTAKYNRLLRIEEELGPKSRFSGNNTYANLKL